jgi:hypothetical protein
MNNTKKSDNDRISFLARMSSQDQRTIIGSNIHVISSYLNVLTNVVLQSNFLLKKLDDDCDMIAVILELIDFRNGECTIDGFTVDEMDFMMNFLCTM